MAQALALALVTEGCGIVYSKARGGIPFKKVRPSWNRRAKKVEVEKKKVELTWTKLLLACGWE